MTTQIRKLQCGGYVATASQGDACFSVVGKDRFAALRIAITELVVFIYRHAQ